MFITHLQNLHYFLNVRKLSLERSRRNRGPVEIAERDFTLARLEQEITLCDQFIAAVETHKATLPA